MRLTETGLAQLSPEPIRRAARRLRWFKASFQQQVDAISAESGVRFEVDNGRLVHTFLNWLREFEAQKPRSPRARQAYVGFASGLMLRQMIKTQPLRVVSVPDATDPSNPAYFWPEGYVFVAYCLNVRRAILEQDFDEARQVSPDFADLRVWWSFKENVGENSSDAISFLDLFAGETPNWSFPSIFFAETSIPVRLPRGRRGAFVAPGAQDASGPQNAKAAPPRPAPSASLPSSFSTQAAGRNAAMSSGKISHLGGEAQQISHHLPQSCQLVIFGLDGTLADTSAMMLDELCQLINESGVPITLDETRRRFLGTSVTVPMTYVAEQTRRICPGHFRENWEDRIRKRLAAGVTLLPGALPFMEDLKRRQIAVALVSAGSDALADVVLEKADLKRRFAGAVQGAGKIASGKPLSDLALAVAAEAGLHSQACVVIHDTPETIAAAAQAGMFAIGHVGGTHLRAVRDAQREALLQSGARFVLESYADLADS